MGNKFSQAQSNNEYTHEEIQANIRQLLNVNKSNDYDHAPSDAGMITSASALSMVGTSTNMILRGGESDIISDSIMNTTMTYDYGDVGKGKRPNDPIFDPTSSTSRSELDKIRDALMAQIKKENDTKQTAGKLSHTESFINRVFQEGYNECGDNDKYKSRSHRQSGGVFSYLEANLTESDNIIFNNYHNQSGGLFSYLGSDSNMSESDSRMFHNGHNQYGGALSYLDNIMANSDCDSDTNAFLRQLFGGARDNVKGDENEETTDENDIESEPDTSDSDLDSDSDMETEDFDDLTDSDSDETESEKNRNERKRKIEKERDEKKKKIDTESNELKKGVEDESAKRKNVIDSENESESESESESENESESESESESNKSNKIPESSTSSYIKNVHNIKSGSEKALSISSFNVSSTKSKKGGKTKTKKSKGKKIPKLSNSSIKINIIPFYSTDSNSNNMNEHSTTSFKQTTSSNNVPFYSTENSVQHPYVKNRFSKL